MSTRNRVLRGEDQRDFLGRVRKWKQEWTQDEAFTKLKPKSFKHLKWVATDERDAGAPGKRFPNILPLPTPNGKPRPPAFMRPAVAPVAVAPNMPKVSLKLKLTTSSSTPNL